MQEIAVLIIEDEPLWARSLETNLQDFGFSVAGIATDVETAAVALHNKNYDIVLLDIHLQGRESGIELGRLINALYQKPYIFVTASMDPQTAKAAIAANPSAYLTKPVHPASLFTTIQTAISNYSQKLTSKPGDQLQDESFFVKQGEKYKRLVWTDIVSLHSEKNYTGLLNAVDGTTSFIRSTLPKTLQYLVPARLQPGFVQVNRSEVVQVSFIRELVKDEVITPYRSFKVSESQVKNLREKLRIIG